MIKLPVTDSDGYPIQVRGATNYPGLYFVGLPWLSTAAPGPIYGVGEDAEYIAEKIAASRDSLDDARDSSAAQISPPEIEFTLQAASPVATGIGRLIAALLSSTFQFLIDGFAMCARLFPGAFPLDAYLVNPEASSSSSQ